MRCVFTILTFCFLLGLPVEIFAASNLRTALVIGNSAYRNAPLRNPANDALDISRALKRLRFQVTLLRNADQRKMKSAIRKFGKQLTKGGVGLFYYAGHGMQVDGRNYLIPVDARIESPSDVEYEAVDAGRVLGKMEDAGNDMNIVILDACRDNPFSRSWRSGRKGLARMDAPKGSYIAYATAPGSVAADGSGRNGTYTKSLLRHMEVPGLTLEGVMKRVRKEVIDTTGSRQVPWASTSLVGDFYFNPGRGLSVVGKPSAGEVPVKKKAAEQYPAKRSGDREFETRELRYAKSLVERGKKSEAKRIVNGLLKKDDDTVLAEAMYCQVIWGFAANDRETCEKLKAYYPDFKWLASAEKTVAEREKVRKIEAEKRRKAEAKRKRIEAEKRRKAEAEQKRLVAIRKKQEEERQRKAEEERKRVEAEKKRRAEAELRRLKAQWQRLGMQFVYIKPGSFMMGSPLLEQSGDSSERQHRVTLTAGFYMQTTEVTQGQWRAVMGSNPSHFKNCGDNCPVESVSWNDVQAFIRKLNEKGGTGRYRLPTEAEWEYAARAGSTTAFANGGITEFLCGYDPNLAAMGWYCGNAKKKTQPVARKQPNAWGLYDMHGNVSEWCQDWYGDYPAGSVTDPTGPSSGADRVHRGGGWFSGALYCRSAFHVGVEPGHSSLLLGFRLAFSPGQ